MLPAVLMLRLNRRKARLCQTGTTRLSLLCLLTLMPTAYEAPAETMRIFWLVALLTARRLLPWQQNCQKVHIGKEYFDAQKAHTFIKQPLKNIDVPDSAVYHICMDTKPQSARRGMYERRKDVER